MLLTQLLHINNPSSASQPHAAATLDRAPVGKPLRIHTLQPGAGESARHLQAYGLLPGRSVLVLAQHPLTIIQIEQTELALERSLAKLILVDLS